MKKRNNYIDRNELHSEMKTYKDTGIISERLGQLFLTMIDHILGHSNFRNYAYDLKEEMKSHALLMIIKYVHNCNAYERDATSVFAYVTTIIFNAYRQVLKKYYKQLNLKRELEKHYISMIENIFGINIKSEYLDNFKININNNDAQ